MCTNKCLCSRSPVLHMQWSGFMNAHANLKGSKKSSCELLGKARRGLQFPSSEARNPLVENYDCSFPWQSKAKQSRKFVEAIISSRWCFYNHVFGFATSWYSPFSTLTPFSLLLISVPTVMPDAGEGWLTWLKEPLQKPAKFKTSNLDQLEKMDKVLGPVSYASDL